MKSSDFCGLILFSLPQIFVTSVLFLPFHFYMLALIVWKYYQWLFVVWNLSVNRWNYRKCLVYIYIYITLFNALLRKVSNRILYFPTSLQVLTSPFSYKARTLLTCFSTLSCSTVMESAGSKTGRDWIYLHLHAISMCERAFHFLFCDSNYVMRPPKWPQSKTVFRQKQGAAILSLVAAGGATF
jgi:hypothetical protein